MSRENIPGNDIITGRFLSKPDVPFNKQDSEYLPGTSDNPSSRGEEFKQLDEFPGGVKNPEEILLEKEKNSSGSNVEKPNLGSGKELSLEKYRELEGYKNDTDKKEDHHTEHDGLGEKLKLDGLNKDAVNRKKIIYGRGRREGSSRNYGRKPKGKQEKGELSIKDRAKKDLECNAGLDIEDVKDAV